MMNSQAHAGSRPMGPAAAIGKLIGFMIMLAFLARIGWFILTVVGMSGLG